MNDQANDFFVHPSAIIDPGAVIGNGTRIWHFCHICAGAQIGSNCVIGQGCFIAGGATVGNGCKIQNGVSLFAGVFLEDDVFCGPHMVFTNVINPRAFIERKNEFRPTRIGRGATIGANATILCGHQIGRYALIGAGAVVTRNVPDFALMVGTPARQRGWVDRAGNPLAFGKNAQATGNGGEHYTLHEEAVTLLDDGWKGEQKTDGNQ